MLKKIILLSLLLVTLPVMAEKKAPKPKPIPEADGPTIGYNTVAEAMAALRKDPTVHLVSDMDWTIFRIGGPGQPTYVLWNFTPAGHPAHPTAVKRTLYERDGQLVIDMDIACEARKSACEKVVRDFMAANDGMRRFYPQPSQPQK